jgi:hypothetical protein
MIRMEDTPEEIATTEPGAVVPEHGFRAHDVAGGWLGTYHYKGRFAPPCRFEMTLRALTGEAPGRFTGTILDDGPLGEAAVEKGAQDGRHVRFTKVYRSANAHYGVVPIHYVGTLSEDGKRLSGTWKMTTLVGPSGRRVSDTGSWEARRLWGEQAEAASEGEPEVVAVGRELAGAAAGR